MDEWRVFNENGILQMNQSPVGILAYFFVFHDQGDTIKKLIECTQYVGQLMVAITNVLYTVQS